MYDEKLIQDFKQKDPHMPGEFWYVQYGDYCRYHKIDYSNHTYQEYEDIMEKVYRMFVYENKLFTESITGKIVKADANDVLS